ncbi:hypothetical protein VE03_05091 [Pseudogymnoascus sp. 23342-1-I1]|nr:hypothetical protein VE03_05091 [Pseudogymnoascus sp. 23342-1-I1]
MGVVSVLGPTGSLVSLINATGMLSKELYCLARGVRAARKDIRKFARKLSMFSWSSNEACSCLLRHYSNETGLDTLSNAKKKRFLKRAEESAKEILKDVESISPRILSMEPSGIELGLISKIKWYRRKSEVRDLDFEMNALQTSLALLMSTVTYEVQIRNKADPEALAITMAQITNFIEVAEDMTSRFEKLEDSQRATDNTVKRLSALLDNVIHVADRQLDDADDAREATGLYERGRWVLKKDTVPVTHVFTSPRRSGMKTRIQRSRPGSPQPPPPSERIPIDIPTSNQGKGKERQTNHEPPEASSLRDVQDPGDNSGPENNRSTQPPETHLPQETATPYLKPPGASDEYEEINGYISQTMSRNSKSSSRTITARLYPNFSMNVMSQALAEQLGLNITALTDEDAAKTFPIIRSSRDRSNHSVGLVRFVWHTPTDIISITCTVFEREIVPGVPLGLGKPYIQQIETAGRPIGRQNSRSGAGS